MANSIFQTIHLPAANTEITLKFRVGGGQAGSTTYQISGQKEVTKEGDFSINLKTNDLNNKEIEFSARCADVNPNSNKLLYTVELIGLQSSSPWTMTKTVKAHGVYNFFGTIEFYK